MTKTIRYFALPNGKIPFINWLDSINDKPTKIRILTRIDRMTIGNLGDYKSIGDDIFELRLHFGGGYRIYFTETAKNEIVILFAGKKKNQNKDIQKTKKMWTITRNSHE